MPPSKDTFSPLVTTIDHPVTEAPSFKQHSNELRAALSPLSPAHGYAALLWSFAVLLRPKVMLRVALLSQPEAEARRFEKWRSDPEAIIL